jgi:ABC-type multidrug transport system ATPase subunit
MPSIPPLSISGLTLCRGGKQVVRGLNLVTRPGVTLLLGDNGAGKSTLIAALLDHIDAAVGTIQIFNSDARRPGSRQAVFYLPERFESPWYLSGHEFLQYALGLRGQPYQPEWGKVQAERLTLDPSALKRRAREYSKGMTQKLGLTAAFLSDAQLLVLDEPTSGLDPTARAAFLSEVEVFTQKGRDFFITTHALADATRLAASTEATLAILRSGQLKAFGLLPDLLHNQNQPDLESLYANIL